MHSKKSDFRCFLFSEQGCAHPGAHAQGRPGNILPSILRYFQITRQGRSKADHGVLQRWAIPGSAEAPLPAPQQTEEFPISRTSPRQIHSRSYEIHMGVTQGAQRLSDVVFQVSSRLFRALNVTVLETVGISNVTSASDRKYCGCLERKAVRFCFADASISGGCLS